MIKSFNEWINEAEINQKEAEKVKEYLLSIVDKAGNFKSGKEEEAKEYIDKNYINVYKKYVKEFGEKFDDNEFTEWITYTQVMPNRFFSN